MNQVDKKNPALIQISEENPDNISQPQINPRSESDLEKDGWERRQIMGPDRLEETIQLYQEIGFEVHQEKVNQSEFDASCQACALVASNFFTIIYTRKIK